MQDMGSNMFFDKHDEEQCEFRSALYFCKQKQVASAACAIINYTALMKTNRMHSQHFTPFSKASMSH